jgi:hypothetical protein
MGGPAIHVRPWPGAASCRAARVRGGCAERASWAARVNSARQAGREKRGSIDGAAWFLSGPTGAAAPGLWSGRKLYQARRPSRGPTRGRQRAVNPVVPRPPEAIHCSRCQVTASSRRAPKRSSGGRERPRPRRVSRRPQRTPPGSGGRPQVGPRRCLRTGAATAVGSPSTASTPACDRGGTAAAWRSAQRRRSATTRGGGEQRMIRRRRPRWRRAGRTRSVTLPPAPPAPAR